MQDLTDRVTLKESQYKDSTNLNARILLHKRFSVNPYGWYHWLMDQFDGLEAGLLLELGCGSGALWSQRSGGIFPGCRFILTDFSEGMLKQAKRQLGDQESYRFMVVDAQDLPFKTRQFDVVIANHMLYHVPDRTKVLSEIHRVLKPGKKFYASTVGKSHLHELSELMARFDPGLAFVDGGAENFNLQNGGQQIEAGFSEVLVTKYEDSLEITEAQPLIDYVISIVDRPMDLVEQRSLADFIRHEINQKGTIHITKESGLFTAVSSTVPGLT